MRLLSYESTESMAKAAAKEIALLASSCISARGLFTFVLSGGNTPKPVYETLAKNRSIDWTRVHLFWGDERFVPHDDQQSNYRMAKQSLLDHIAIPPQNIHPIPTGAPSPEDSAKSYAQEIEPFLPFDLVLLGLGEDGHTASLFPGSEFDPNDKRLVIATHSPKPPLERVSLSLRVINEARSVFFLVAGKDKRNILSAVLQASKEPAPSYPAAWVKPTEELVWFVDKAAYPEA